MVALVIFISFLFSFFSNFSLIIDYCLCDNNNKRVSSEEVQSRKPKPGAEDLTFGECWQAGATAGLRARSELPTETDPA